MRLCTFEDAAVGGLAPLSTARPVIDLLCGLSSLGTKQHRAMRATAVAAFVRPTVARVAALSHPHVNESDWLLRGPAVLVNARWVPPPRFAPPAETDGPFVAVIDGVVAYAVLFPNELSACTPHTIDACLREWRKELTIRLAPGRLAARPWDLVEWTGDEIATDFAALGRDEVGNRPSTLTLVGPSSVLWVHDSARVDPFVVADTTAGPVVIDRDAVVTSFTRLEGPCYVGPRTQVFSANVRGGTSLGPNCRVGGEVSASVLLANSNKSHEGYLGHSYVGEWVNIGAGTHFSDLRNDYADVRVPTTDGSVSTGLTKAGAYLGDHSKAGVGCRLNAGTSVGPFAQLLPSADLLPKHVPAFCTVDHGRLIDCADPHPLFEAAVRVTARRGEEFSPEHRALFKGLFDRGAGHRRTVVHETELRRLRRG
ncbi:MAG TPA: putative sugar nucleotidyl transferase [Gemmataceae bacterium]|jgi:UDP-N-acetylglucosamine diphosphorylase/glucosamine-1-phosphate N-acetyltransferase|nr:putative sugar nucleotidyl transferase [Gemmataceae bacterium]